LLIVLLVQVEAKFGESAERRAACKWSEIV
jgi:hypothetical protein